jgi:hypothetical protein
MALAAEATAAQMGLHLDETGSLVGPKAAPADAVPDGQAAPAPAQAAAPATPVAPVKATTPAASVPEPPVVGQASPDDEAAAKKKTLLGN